MRKPTMAADADAMGRLGFGAEVVVRCGRGEAHVRFLREEVAPHGVVLDADARVVHAAKDATPSLPADVFDGFPTKEQVDAYLAEPEVKARIANAAARVEAAPIRLWEAMLWRGHDYRLELVAGEVPLVGELWSPLAANRTLMRCVKDAELAFGETPAEDKGWIHCGPMRMRQAGTQVEIRARLPMQPSVAGIEDRGSQLARDIQAGLSLSDGFYFRYLRRRG